MHIQWNSQTLEVSEGMILLDLLHHQGFGKNVAVWVNDKRLLQKEYATCVLQEGDRIRVLRPLGGG